MSERVDKAIREIVDFPKKGIVFKDATTAIRKPEIFKEIIDYFVEKFSDTEFDYIAAIESRGFFLAAPVAYLMGKGLIVIRKPGKLPPETISAEYELEYGSDKLEISVDAIKAGQKAIIMDDLMATGGTVAAAVELIEKLGASVPKVAFLMELEALKGRDKLSSKINVVSMLKY